ncbi:hypothetical protein [Acidovorax delafieldii]|jgi:hypothetical protein|nr:hypothetical protein [Acidovorax delafieldii]
MKILSAVCFSLFSGLCWAGTSISLCSADEIVFLSCSLGHKLLSVCASKDLSSDRGYIEYRFGKQNLIELRYPDKSLPPKQAFTFLALGTGQAVENSLRFRNGEYTYTVYSVGGRTFEDHGVYVRKDNALISRQACRTKIVGNLGTTEFTQKIIGAGVPKPEREYSVYE